MVLLLSFSALLLKAQNLEKCFVSVGQKKNFHLKFIEDQNGNNKIRYEGKTANIQLKRLKEVEVTSNTKGLQQSVIRTVFSEVVDGEILGQYAFDTQGAVFLSGYYISKTKKKIKLTIEECFY